MAASGSERIAPALAGAVLLALGSSCGNPKTEPAPPLGRADASYSALYPHHVDVCALSQIRPLAAPSGGSAGHAVMYLSGACRRADAAIPLLETCDPPAGTGVSVNKIFKNVNWVAIPGRVLFFEGDLIRGERLTREHFEATVRRAVDLEIFRGIEVHREQRRSRRRRSRCEIRPARRLRVALLDRQLYCRQPRKERPVKAPAGSRVGGPGHRARYRYK